MITFLRPKILPLLLSVALLTAGGMLLLQRTPQLLQNAYTDLFKTAFLGILLEALPFVLLGALLSSLLRVYVPDEWVSRWIPKSPFLAIVFGCALGIVFPVCECGMIPLVRRLMHKGMPLYVGIVFILSGPILNPVVYGATMTAFRAHPDIAYARLGLAFAVAALIGLIVYMTAKRPVLRHSLRGEGMEPHDNEARGGKAAAALVHAADEFFEMGKYLIIGCLLTAGIQTFLEHDKLAAIGERPLGSYFFMMGLAFVLSLCSTSDAFVASTFLHTFPEGALLAFMVLGPMLDFKNSLMLLSLFKTRFALYLFFLIFSLVFTGSVLLSLWL